MPSAYLLVSHGSRDPRPQVAMEQLAGLVSQRLAAPTRCSQLVGTACLELSPMPLHEQIKEFGDRALAAGCNRIQVVPLFLLPGVHVMEDIPAQVAIARQAVGEKLQIDLRPHLGTHPGIVHLLATQLAAKKTDAWIVLAHGSRRPSSKQPVEAIAKQLESQVAPHEGAVSRNGVAVTAYWAVAPSLESRVKQLISAGYRQIGILPYFLFAGGITDAIAIALEQLKVHPDTLLELAQPLGASAELADLIVDLIDQ